MASFKVPCPSCEHQVPIKDASLIGTKVECPKCKYRFKVEEPKGGVPKDNEKSEKPDKKKKAAATGDKKKKSKKVAAVIVGVIAVGVLAAVGLTMMGGDDKKKNNTNTGFRGNTGNTGNTGDPGTGDPGTGEPGTGDPKKEEDKKPTPKPKPVAPASDKNPTNLLPNDTVAVYRVDVDKVRYTPANFLFDGTMLEMFRRSFGFDAEQVAVYHHAFVGDAREPFGVIRLRSPVFEREVVAGMAPVSGSKSVGKKWTLYSFKSNPFANGLENTLAFASLFGEWYKELPPGPGKQPAGPRVYGLCVYDSQHVLVGDATRLDAFLTGLQGNGYPKFLSATKPTGDQELAEQPLYLSIDPKLKRALRALGAETASPAPLLYAERFAQGAYDPKLLKADYQAVGAVLDPLLTHTNYLAAALTSFSTNGVTGAVRLDMTSGTAAFEAVRDQLLPNLPLAAWAASLFLDTPVEFRNLTTSGVTPAVISSPDGGEPGRPGVGGIGPRPGGIVGPPGGSLGPTPGGFGGPDAGGGQPGDMGSPGDVGMPGGVGMPIDPNRQPVPPSHIDLMLTDQVVTLALDLNWTNETYRVKIEPRLVGLANTLKGKMAVFTSDESYYRLAATLPMFKEEPRFPAGNPRRSKEMVNFPRGTAYRSRDISRLGIDYPPHTRVSMFAEMLPYFGREPLYQGINRDKAWFEGDNLKAGEAWVPELVVPSYPQSAWRATSPFVPDGRVLGGTNYVGIAGRGLDAARYDPAEQPKLVGIVGYDWGSKVEDVTDGLSNTIYLMQTPPGLSQPWIAGGGATVRGLNEADPMRGFAHTYGTPDKKPGTYALMGDGSVRFIPANIDRELLLGMSTRAGMEALADLNTAAPRVDPPKKKPEPEPKADPKAAAGKAELAPPPREKK